MLWRNPIGASDKALAEEEALDLSAFLDELSRLPVEPDGAEAVYDGMDSPTWPMAIREGK